MTEKQRHSHGAGFPLLNIDVLIEDDQKIVYLNGHSDMLGGLIVTNNRSIADRLRFFQKAIGGVETIITHPASMTHAAIPAELRKQIGVTEGLVRISVGIEDVEDIIADIDAALNG